MSSVRYLEIASTYRDRTRWPQSADFEIPISVNGRKDCKQAVDPVALSSTVMKWQSNKFKANSVGSTPIISFSLITTGSRVIIVEEVTPGDFYRDQGSSIDLGDCYYNGATISLTKYYTIYEWKLLTTGSGVTRMRVQVTLNTVVTEAIGSLGLITDPTNVSTNLDNPIFFVPRGPNDNNAFVNHYLINETANQCRQIYYYDGTNHLLSINTDPTTGGEVIIGWSDTHVYSIRKERPVIFQSFNFIDPTIGGGPVSKTTFILSPSISLPNAIGSFIELRTLDHASNEIRSIIKYYNINGNIFTGTVNTIDIPATTKIHGAYTGLYLNITNGTSAGDTRLITKHVLNKDTIGNIINETLTVSSNFSLSPDNTSTFLINSGIVETEFSINISNNLFWFLPCSYDNLNPFTQITCISESNEMTCYEIELVSLILPNKTIWAANGGRLGSYPYLYVRLSNVSSSGAGVKNIFYSNNPNSTRALFRTKIDDISEATPFVKFNGDGIVQTVKFKPRDNLRFTVYFPNGQTFDTILNERFSPYEPNLSTQISALFSLKRLNLN